MKFGLKLWSTNIDLVSQAIQSIDEKIFDYIELFVVPDTQITPFMVDVPFIIHVPNEKFGVNIGDVTKKENNLHKINESIRWANKLDAKYIIIHAGDGSILCANDTLREIIDNRILVENMPKIGLNNEHMIGYSPEHIKEIIEHSNIGLCLDFGHAAKASVSIGLEYKEYINMFLEFYPKVFHISDVTLKYEKDNHLNIGEGEFDFGYLLYCINRNPSKLVTIETPRIGQKSLDSDIMNVQLLKRLQ